MLMISIILGLVTAIIVTAYANQHFKENSTHYCDADKMMAVVIGCAAGLFYPVAWALAIIYVASEKFREEFVE